MVGGFTQKELICTFVVFFVICAPILSIIAHLWFEIWSIGAIVSFGLAALLTAKASHTAYIVKKGRPSYLMWVDFRRKLQDEGFLGIKIDFKYIKSTSWSINIKDK